MKNIVALSGVLIGCILASLPYLPSQPDNKPSSVHTQSIVFNDAPDEQVQKNLADLTAILNIQIPQPNSPMQDWEKFWINIEAIDIGNHDSPMSNTSPLLSLYTYIAKYEPAIFYKRMAYLVNSYHFIDNLMDVGLLSDWYDQVKDPHPWVLVSRGAIKVLISKYGIKTAKELAAKGFLLAKPNRYKVNLYNLRFAIDAMSKAERTLIIDRLLQGKFQYDPRGVKALIGLNGISELQLVQLIKAQAYPQKSMSSYMTTALKLNDPEYVLEMAKDAASNSSQPANFYCSGCALSLYTDGLIGDELVKYAKLNRMNVIFIDNNLVIKKSVNLNSENSL